MSIRSRFYLDKDHARVAGVCAGLADLLGWDVMAVRIGWVVAGIFWAPVAIVTYIVAAWLLDPKPGSGYPEARYRRRHFDFGRRDYQRTEEPLSASYRLSDAKSRFESLERRLRDLEGTVTSKEFQMDRELRGSGRP